MMKTRWSFFTDQAVSDDKDTSNKDVTEFRETSGDQAMLSNQELFIRDTKREELGRICEMERGEARSSITPYSLDRHQVEFTKPEVVYKSIWRDELSRGRVWLDVFETNKRARHVYEQCGYCTFGSFEHEGKTLLLYEKAV